MTYLNFTSVTIVPLKGNRIPSSGIAKVRLQYSPSSDCGYISVITGLPEPKDNTMYIVNEYVSYVAALQGRNDCIEVEEAMKTL